MPYVTSHFAAFLLLFGFFFHGAANAHDMGDGAHITTLITHDKNGNADYQWTLDITVQELVSQFPEYDIDENGKISPLEYGAIDARQVVNYVLAKLAIKNGVNACAITIVSYTIEKHRRADFMSFPLSVSCQQDIQTLTVSYALFFDQNPYHQGTWTVVYEQQPSIQYFWEDQRQRDFTVSSQSSAQVFASFIRKGIHHIAIGFDHILFLVSLLLTAVFNRRGKQWLPTPSGKEAFWNVAKIVTVFTLAHSVTLSLAVLRLVPLPSPVWVESTIALSIIVMAVHNIRPWIRFDALLITFAFGLIHGFGFANVLLEYPLSDQGLVVSLVAFNAGVELGQLVIALVVAPLLFYARYYPWYRSGFVPAISVCIVLIGFYWLIERLIL